MRICIDGRMLDYSGIGVYIRFILSFFNKNFSLEDFLESKSNIAFEFFQVDFNADVYSIYEQYAYIKQIQNCDVFWSPHWNIPLFPIRAKTRMVTIHDVYHLAFTDQFSLHKRYYAKFMINQAVKRSDIILTVSEFSRQEIIKYTGIQKTIHVVHNGIGVEPSVYSDENGSLVDSRYILYVGNVKPHKNLSRALQAFEALPENFQDFKFVIVGKKENFITGDNAFVESALKNDKVVFTGYVDDSALVAYYKFATALFFPSLYEGFGLPPLEAQACGTPCLVSNAASLPEVCGDSVLYCDPYNVENMIEQLETLLSDENIQEQLIQKGYENIKRFSWENSAQQILKIIEENT